MAERAGIEEGEDVHVDTDLVGGKRGRKEEMEGETNKMCM